MLTITFAFVVATCLFLVFSQTRALGVVGVFILLCINPVLFGLLFLSGAYVWNKLFRKRYYPLARLLPKENKKNILLPLITLPWLGSSIPTAEAPTLPTTTSLSTTSSQESEEGDVRSAAPG
jgi:hypothetical protein